MPRYLAVYTMRPEDLAGFRKISKSEQDAVDAAGVPAWAEWEKANEGFIRNRGGMVGKTLRVTKTGIEEATNDICGYLVIEAESAEAAAKIFKTHPHITIFPGYSVDIMPFVAGDGS
ncbi:hypothetical protein VW35_09085 [Devosia soli]|uniref:YCII-related domain-containing protein n=1 Tax=Devosia soli TaxID=361041 RepID=A0A0F5L8Z6_9HYPH|nr:hypothetical protein [Devosia soli]KKB78669.1 hypothetical protein VW35_09085 [Devosia soli]